MKIPTVKWAWYLDPRNIDPPYKRLCLRISYAGSRYFQRFDPTIKVTDEQWELLSKQRQGQNVTKKMLNDAQYTQELLNDLQGIVAAHERRLESTVQIGRVGLSNSTSARLQAIRNVSCTASSASDSSFKVLKA